MRGERWSPAQAALHVGMEAPPFGLHRRSKLGIGLCVPKVRLAESTACIASAVAEQGIPAALPMTSRTPK
jgi:hypothetical protein